MLKSLWDMTELVKSSFSDWNTTLWKDINVEQMELDCKKFVKVRGGRREEARSGVWRWSSLTDSYLLLSLLLLLLGVVIIVIIITVVVVTIITIVLL